MTRALRVLLIEDVEDDAELLLLELARGGYDVRHERVETAAGVIDALERSTWDLILSDYAMPALDAPRALALVKERRVDVPFIIVSGTVDEVTAVAAMRAGAHDFIAKGKLARLLPVIERELREAAGRAERGRMEEQLMVSDRMASLGTLAAGVAHEINNPLAAVLGNLDVVVVELAAALAGYEAGTERDAPAVPPAVGRLAACVVTSLEALADAREAALQCAELSRDLKAFSWRNHDRRPVDVCRLLDSSLRLARHEIRHRATVVRDYENVPAVAANETRLGQLFLNLLVNAAQAITPGDAPRQQIRVVVRLAEDGRVLVEVHDTGPGIPKDVLPHIFDAFFTTKPRGVGTGLGLAICHRVVTELGGEITALTTPGSGTMFRVLLPVASAPAASIEPPPVVPTVPLRRGKILIVDDDELVLNTAHRILAPHHDVWATTNPRAALDRLHGGARYDLVLCDLLMPDVSGTAFHQELARRLPDQAGRIVFMTGGAFTADAQAFLESTHQPRIDKPFDATTLRRAVDRFLRGT